MHDYISYIYVFINIHEYLNVNKYTWMYFIYTYIFISFICFIYYIIILFSIFMSLFYMFYIYFIWLYMISHIYIFGNYVSAVSDILIDKWCLL